MLPTGNTGNAPLLTETAFAKDPNSERGEHGGLSSFQTMLCPSFCAPCDGITCLSLLLFCGVRDDLALVHCGRWHCFCCCRVKSQSMRSFSIRWCCNSCRLRISSASCSCNSQASRVFVITCRCRSCWRCKKLTPWAPPNSTSFAPGTLQAGPLSWAWTLMRLAASSANRICSSRTISQSSARLKSEFSGSNSASLDGRLSAEPPVMAG
mmetsp:Transcript_100219/g.299162  ORF Transcript_100219/g.299162 Transcript_100219/m.299162 type:complete len:209 (-) Transcript_100219:74-700(-)